MAAKRAPHEVWDALVREAREDAIEEALSASDEEVEAELRKAGFDVEQLNAQADAWLAELEGAPGRRARGEPAESASAEIGAWESAAPPPERRSGSVRWALLLAAALSAAAGAIYALARNHAPPPQAPPVTPPSAVVPPAPAPQAPSATQAPADQPKPLPEKPPREP